MKLLHPSDADSPERKKEMNFGFYSAGNIKELEQFKSVCNQLLSRTYVVRTYIPRERAGEQPDYTFLSLCIMRLMQDYPEPSGLELA